jgi:hypothetical protein
LLSNTLNLFSSPRVSGCVTIRADISVANEWKLKPLGEFHIIMNSQTWALSMAFSWNCDPCGPKRMP